jgi:glycosidase
MNYRFRQAVIGFARTTPFTDSTGTIPPLTPRQLDNALKAVLADYPPQAAAVSFNLVDSHDTNRVLFALDGDKQRQRLAALLQFTTPGAPMIYYGDEAAIDAPGRSGFGDPYNRAPYPWEDESGDVNVYGPPDAAMIAYYSRLALIRNEYPSLRTGSFRTLFANASVYAFSRVAPPHDPVIVALNKSGQAASVRIPLGAAYPQTGAIFQNAFDGARYEVADGAVQVTVPALGGIVLVPCC